MLTPRPTFSQDIFDSLRAFNQDLLDADQRLRDILGVDNFLPQVRMAAPQSISTQPDETASAPATT